jgi:GNAT superfamily N-acetyltransferase
MDGLSLDFEPFVGGDVRRHLNDGINFHNMAATGAVAYFPANFVLRSARGEVMGGLLGDVWGGWLQIHVLWVAQALRGQGCGARLMAAAEAYAVEKGCVGVTLDTFSFQARPFYERLGFTVFGALSDYPPGHARFYLEKRLGA